MGVEVDGDVWASKNSASTENISIGVLAECGTLRMRVDAYESRRDLERAGWVCTLFDDNTPWVGVVDIDCETLSGINGCLLGE